MKKSNIKNSIAIVILTLCLGAFVGLILWLFLQVVSLGTTVIWKIVPNATEINWIVIPMCAIGGCVVGLLHKKYGNYPESLDKVMTKVKQDKHYDYKYMLPMLICAVIPLIFACTCMVYGLTGVVFSSSSEHVVFAAAAISGRVGEMIKNGYTKQRN